VRKCSRDVSLLVRLLRTSHAMIRSFAMHSIHCMLFTQIQCDFNASAERYAGLLTTAAINRKLLRDLRCLSIWKNTKYLHIHLHPPQMQMCERGGIWRPVNGLLGRKT